MSGEGSLFYIEIKVFVPMTDFSDGKIDEVHSNIIEMRKKLRNSINHTVPEGWEAEVLIPDKYSVHPSYDSSGETE